MIILKLNSVIELLKEVIFIRYKEYLWQINIRNIVFYLLLIIAM
jgi:hypothetical protein